MQPELYSFRPTYGALVASSSIRSFQAQLSCVAITIGLLTLDGVVCPGWAQQPTFAGSAQHTAQFDAPAQPLNAVHWTVPVDLVKTGALAHYGVPLITPSNTVIAPVRAAA